MTRVSWLMQRVSDVPDGDDWLSQSEREVLARFWVQKRRRDWRLGRWTAKRALARAGVGGLVETDPTSWTRLSIRATDGGAPCAIADPSPRPLDAAIAGARAAAITAMPGESSQPVDWAVSLSHSGEYGLCALAARPAVVGCDIETIGRRGEEFVVDWFTEPERELVRQATEGAERSRVVTLVWSAKESAVKALGVGLRIDTREVHVQLGDPAMQPMAAATPHARVWRPLEVHVQGRAFGGWWQSNEDRVVTIVADPAPGLPVEL